MLPDPYTTSAKYYDDAYASVAELIDLPFYLELARKIGGPVLEMGCGTGRVLLPIARAGIETCAAKAKNDVHERICPPPGRHAALTDIWEYIAADNLEAADRVIEEIYSKIQALISFPHQGHTRADLTSKPLRFQAVCDHLIVYAPEEKPLSVIAVLHGRRNPRVVAAILPGRS